MNPRCLQVYVVPYLMVNAWLVMITLLQHTHPSLPHYTADGWDWLRGALATCDRSFGFLDTFHHHIADTHVLHHLFSVIPHYHAQVQSPTAQAHPAALSAEQVMAMHAQGRLMGCSAELASTRQRAPLHFWQAMLQCQLCMLNACEPRAISK